MSERCMQMKMKEDFQRSSKGESVAYKTLVKNLRIRRWMKSLK